MELFDCYYIKSSGRTYKTQLNTMANSKLFQYAILWHPTEKQTKDEGLKSKILVPPATLIAADQQSALMAVSMEIPVDKKDQLDQIEICLRPF